MSRWRSGGLGWCGGLEASLLAVSMFVAGCNARGGDRGVGHGGGGTGDDAGADSSGEASASIACNPSATGCLCLVDDGQAGQIDACSPTSVAENETERGVCCVSQSLCVCIRYTCRSDPGSSFCQCGSVLNLSSLTSGSLVGECPEPSAQQRCCFSQDNGTCICSRLACAGEEIAVANCSAAAAGACRPGEEIAACR